MSGNGIAFGTGYGVDDNDVIAYASIDPGQGNGDTINIHIDALAFESNGSNHSYLVCQRTSSNAAGWYLMIDSGGDIRFVADFDGTDYQAEYLGSYFDSTPHRYHVQYTFGSGSNEARIWLDGTELTLSHTAGTGSPVYATNGISLGNDAQFPNKTLRGVLGQAAVWLNDAGGIGISVIDELNNGANPSDFHDYLIFHHVGDSEANAYDAVSDTAGSITGCADYGSDAGFATVRGHVSFRGADNVDYLTTTSDADDDGDDEVQVPQMTAHPPPDSFAWRDNGGTISGVTTERPTLVLDVGEHQIDAVVGFTGNYYSAAEDRISITVQDVDGDVAPHVPVQEHIQWNTHSGGTGLSQSAIAARIALKDWTPNESGAREDDAWAIRIAAGGADMRYGAYVLGLLQIGRQGFGGSYHPTGAEADAFYAGNTLSFLHNNSGTPLDRTAGDEYHFFPNQALTTELIAKITQRAAYEAPSYSGKIPHNPTGGEYAPSEVIFDNNAYDPIAYATYSGTGASTAADIREVKSEQHFNHVFHTVLLRQLSNTFGLLQSGATTPLGLACNAIMIDTDFTSWMVSMRRSCVALRRIFREGWCEVYNETWWSDNRMRLEMGNAQELLAHGIAMNISVIYDADNAHAALKAEFVPVLNDLLQHKGLLYVATRNNQDYGDIYPNTRPSDWDVLMGVPQGVAVESPTGVWTRDYERGGFTWWDNDNGSGSWSYMRYPAPDLAAVSNKTYDEDEAITPFSLSASHQLGEESFTYSIDESGDALPTGLSINSSTGEISGTLGSSAAGTYNMIGRVDEANGGWDTAAFTITVSAVGGGDPDPLIEDDADDEIIDILERYYPMGFAPRTFATGKATVSSTALGLASFGFTNAQIARAENIRVSVESNAVRYRTDGTAPTAATGEPLAAGATRRVWGYADASRFQVIRQSSDATVTVALEAAG